jgi:hypothetical protein
MSGGLTNMVRTTSLPLTPFETVRAQLTLSVFTDFENVSGFHRAGHHDQAVTTVLDQVIGWNQSGDQRGARAWQMGTMYRS